MPAGLTQVQRSSQRCPLASWTHTWGRWHTVSPRLLTAAPGTAMGRAVQGVRVRRVPGFCTIFLTVRWATRGLRWTQHWPLVSHAAALPSGDGVVGCGSQLMCLCCQPGAPCAGCGRVNMFSKGHSCRHGNWLPQHLSGPLLWHTLFLGLTHNSAVASWEEEEGAEGRAGSLPMLAQARGLLFG